MLQDLIISELARPVLEGLAVALVTLLTALVAVVIRWMQRKAKVEQLNLVELSEWRAQQVADVAVAQAEQAFAHGDNENKKAFAKQQVQRGLGDVAKLVGKKAVSLLWGRVDGLIEQGVRKLKSGQ